jgi:hypothetical protein
MSSVVIAGNTSGTVTLLAPDIAGTTTLTLPTTSGTLVTTAGGSTVPFALGSAASPSITFTGDTNTGIFSPGADTIAFSEGGAEVARFNSSGNLLVGATSGFAGGTRATFQSVSGQRTADFFRDNSIASDVDVFRVIANDGGGTVVASARTSGVISAYGIQFPVTQSPSGDANTLDDYEEGTWTPAIADASSGGTSNSTNAAGWYTKIGNQVTIYGKFDALITTGLASGNQVFIRNLPFASANTISVTPGSTNVEGITFSGGSPVPYLTNNTTFFRLRSNASGAGAQILVSSINSGNSWIYFVVTYQV